MKMNKYEEKAKEIIVEKENSDFICFSLIIFAIILTFLLVIIVTIITNVQIDKYKIVLLTVLVFPCNIAFMLLFFPRSLFLKNDKEYQMVKKIMEDYKKKCEKEKEEIEELKKIKNEKTYIELKEYADKL
ncbi:hypothetical protein ACDQ54_05915 [Fusobacterium animalis]|jgi:hypothetical protein|uniref:hypothetical protein n=1 Tax=Fusobacterium animalis TaxID=76859 RepID=UPI0035579FEC